MSPDEKRPHLRAYLTRVFKGQIRGPYATEQSPTWRRLLWLWKRPHVVAKFVRANRMVHWINHTFDLRGIIVLLRHPCAVVASQLDYEHTANNAWEQAEPPNLEDGFFCSLPDEVSTRFASVFRQIKTREETLATIWALDTYCALRLHGDAPGPVVTYEHLVASPQDTIGTLFADLGISLPDAIFRQIDLPSESAASDLHRQDINQQLSKWQRKLTDKQIDRILSVTHDFDLDMYSHHVWPQAE